MPLHCHCDFISLGADAILGRVAASLIFCVFLFPPLGSIRVSNSGDRTLLILFQSGAIGLSFLSPPSLTPSRQTNSEYSGFPTRLEVYKITLQEAD